MTSVPPPPPLPGKTGIKFRGHFLERQKKFSMRQADSHSAEAERFFLFSACLIRARPGRKTRKGEFFFSSSLGLKIVPLRERRGGNGGMEGLLLPVLLSFPPPLSLSLRHPSLRAPATHPKTEQPAMSPHDCQKGKREESGGVGDGSFAPCTRGHEK